MNSNNYYNEKYDNKQNKVLFFDTETNGLDHRKHQVVLAQLMYKGETEATLVPVINGDYTDITATLSAAEVIVGHNLAFDFRMLKYIPGDDQCIIDTMYMSRVGFIGKDVEHSLDKVAARVLGKDVYKAFDKKKMQRSDWSGELTVTQKRYASLDVEVLPEIVEAYRNVFSVAPFHLDMQSMLVGLRMEQNGIPIDTKTIKKDIKLLEARLAEISDMLPVNYNSAKEVKTYLKTENATEATLAELVESKKEHYETALLIVEAKKLHKRLGVMRKMAAAGRYYGLFAPDTKTGRFSSKKENMQNIDHALDKYITGEDTVLVYSDFAGLELRTISVIISDVMAEKFRDGEDLHNFTAKNIFGEGFTKTHRDIAKTCNFSLLYGGSSFTLYRKLLEKGIETDKKDLDPIIEKWKDTFSDIREWQDYKRYEYNRYGEHVVKTPGGRHIWADTLERSLNFGNQGMGAEVAREAAHYIEDRIRNMEGADVVMFVHDSLMVECKENLSDVVMDIVFDGMKYGWKHAKPLDKKGVEMPVEVLCAKSFSDIHSKTNIIKTKEG